ncbi:MAG: YkgJ family cysteine cluster protein [Bacteroidales bacterium]|nr:YkgJ family cysteine cluster protein [Bacteroidales bacterium]
MKKYDINEIRDRAKVELKPNKKLISRLKRMKIRDVDSIVHPLHDDAFDRIDCLECANCCSHISPIITNKDIERLAKNFRIKAADFIDKYLYLDDENDYVFNQTPCPFLGIDNYCSVYDIRPKACAEYPHTDRVKFQQILELSLKNASVCPVVVDVFDNLKKDFGI